MPRWAQCARYPWNVVSTQPVRAVVKANTRWPALSGLRSTS
jgi:hypothetical protein